MEMFVPVEFRSNRGRIGANLDESAGGRKADGAVPEWGQPAVVGADRGGRPAGRGR
jgi:hypothetical protein